MRNVVTDYLIVQTVCTIRKEVCRLKEDVLEELNLNEDHELECKLATGGLPESIWETYSSFANTNGGTILLGIKEHRDSFTVEGLTEKQIIKYQKDFWSTLNDRNKVSKNILLNHHVNPVPVGDKQILRIDVPAADRHDKPVYIGTDPMKGTYKRDYEGDFLCTEEAVRAMFADQRDVSGDIEVIDEMGLDVLNQDTIKGYRIIFEQLHSGHPWNALENDEFLMRIKMALYHLRLQDFCSLARRITLRKFFQIIFWITEKNVMIKQYAGYSALTLMKVIGVEIYMISFARCVHEWMMR